MADAAGAKTEASLLLHLVIRGGGGGVAHVAVAVPPSNTIKRNGSERASERALPMLPTLEGGRGGEPIARHRSFRHQLRSRLRMSSMEGEAHARARLGHAGSSQYCKRNEGAVYCHMRVYMGIVGNTEPFTNALQLLASTSARSHPLGTYPKTRSGR